MSGWRMSRSKYAVQRKTSKKAATGKGDQTRDSCCGSRHAVNGTVPTDNVCPDRLCQGY